MIGLLFSLTFAHAAIDRHLELIRAEAFRAEPPPAVYAAVNIVDEYIRRGVMDFAYGKDTAAAAIVTDGTGVMLPPALALLVRVIRLAPAMPLRQKAQNACVAAQMMLHAAGTNPDLDRVSEALRLALDEVRTCSRELRELHAPERFQ